MSVRRTLGMGLVAFSAFTVLTLLVSAATLWVIGQQQSRVTGPYFEVVRQSQLRSIALIDQQTGTRGFVLSGDPAFLKPFNDGLEQERQALDELQELLAGDREALDSLAAAETAAEEWRRDYALPQIALVTREGKIPISLSDLQAGRATFNRVREADARFDELVLQRRAAAVQRMQSATKFLAGLLGAGAILALLAAALLWRSLQRWITGPLLKLGDEVRMVSEGELTRTIEPQGPAEIRRLASDVDDMRQRVVAQYAEPTIARSEAEAAQQLIEEQAVELRRSNRDLEQFAYVASHDLQEPLRKISSFCQMLERRYKGQLDERGDQYIAFAVDGAKRMQVLINDLLVFSRVGRMNTAFTEVDLQACFDQAVRVLESRIAESGAVVTCDPLPTVQGEGSLLTQLFQNMIGNAVKFRGDREPRVHIGLSRRESPDGDSGEWEFSCSDNGIGIDAQYAEKIFLIFQRLHAKEEYTGTGIGLALCKKIVEYHGGRIWLDTEASSVEGDTASSAEGNPGTVFRWTLPVAVSSDVATNAVSGTSVGAGAADMGQVRLPSTSPAATSTGASA